MCCLPVARLRPAARCLTVVAACGASASAPEAAHAQTAAPAAEPPAGAASTPAAAASARAETTLPAVRVKAGADKETATSPVGGYTARRSATGTKTDTPVLETPQSISVVPRERIDAIGATTLNEALGYTPGVRISAYGDDSRYDWVVLRGFDAYLPGYYLDGLHARNNNTRATWRLDSYGAERIEVLRGPASVLYGQNGPGGMINVVSKRPLAEPLRELQLQLGTHNRKQLAGDFPGPLSDDGKVLGRLTALVRDSGTQVDHVADDRIFVAPALTWNPSADTSFTLLSHYQRDRAGTSLGFLPVQGTLLPNPNGPIPRSRFAGEPDYDHFDQTQWAVGYALEHRIDPVWTLRQNARHGRIDLDYTQLIAAGFTADSRTINRSAFGSREKVAATTIDHQVQAQFQTGAWQHTVLFGLDLQYNRFDQVTFFGAAPPLDIYAPVYGQPVPTIAPYADAIVRLSQGGLYVQEQAKLGERWVFTLGARHDEARIETDDRLTGTPLEQRDHKASGRAGVVYVADNGWAPYASWSTSFAPNTTVDPATGRPFKAETGKQYEVGVRWQPAGNGHSVSAALFDLTRRNYVTFDSAFVAGAKGEVVVRGLELEAAFKPMAGANLLLSYTHTPKAEVTASNNPAEIGKRQSATPEHAASVWADYRLRSGALQGLRIGMGVRHTGARRGDNEAAPAAIPAFTLLDLGLDYDLARWRLALNVRNAADKTYVANCGGTNCYYGSGRTVVGSATYRF